MNCLLCTVACVNTRRCDENMHKCDCNLAPDRVRSLPLVATLADIVLFWIAGKIETRLRHRSMHLIEQNVRERA